MKETSIFVDESGDFGPFATHSPYYIVAFVVHNQSYDILPELTKLDKELSLLGYPNHCVHVGPIIRKEPPYHMENIATRRKILHKMYAFMRHSKITFHTISINKKETTSPEELSEKLSKKIDAWIRENYQDFLDCDIVKLYYDGGQRELATVLSTVFHALLPNFEFRRVKPDDYRLFQAADLVCSMRLLELKASAHTLSTSEQVFFGGEKNLLKKHIKPLKELSTRKF